jgi:L-asparaginase
MAAKIPYEIVTHDTASPDSPKAKILLIYTGGTFGMGKDEHGTLVPFDFRDLLLKAPLLQNFALEVTVLAFKNPVDSSDISPDHWTELALLIREYYDTHDGFVILHGTDTMAYTASALSFILHGLNKPVILTGAQLPITEVRTDALENLVTALEIASYKLPDGQMKIKEVCISFNNQLLRGNRAQKVQSNKFDAFNSANYPVLAQSGIEIVYNDAFLYKGDLSKDLEVMQGWCRQVMVIKVFPGMHPDIFESIFTNSRLKAVILETFGSGNIMSEQWLVELLKSAIDRGVIIVNVSQCMGGEAIQGKYKASEVLAELGVVNGFDLTTEAALTKLMYLLGQDESLNSTIEQMISPISGEMTLR